MRRRSWAHLLCVAAVAIAAWPAAPAYADADPPSDYLYGVVNDLYLPLDLPTPAPRKAELLRLLKTARASGHPYKLAIVAGPSDLGSVPAFINHPANYAKFLYGEIGFNLQPQHATLVVVMPTGLAVAGADAAAGRVALARLHVAPDASTTTLAQIGAKAVEAVARAGGHPIAADGGDGGLSWGWWLALGGLAVLAVAVTTHRLRAARG